MRHRSVDNRSVTDVAIDRLGDFLLREMETPALVDQIPDGTHLFHGAFDDSELTQRSLQLAGDILLGMLLGYVKEAPLLMLYEYQPEQETLLDLSSEIHKQGALDAIHTLRLM
jgi:hypothetical protein